MSADSRPYYLLGGKRLTAISERVRQALATIARAWWAEPRGIQLIAVTAFENAPQSWRATRLRYVVRDGDIWLGYIASESACVKLAEGWLGCEVTAPSPLVELLEREFCQELFAELRGPGGPALTFADSDWSQLPATALQAGAGTAIIEVDIDGVPLALIVPARAWPELIDVPAQPATRTLQPAASAVPGTRIRLEARLPPVQVSLAEVTALAPGDFLDLQLDLTGQVRIVSRDVDLGLAAVVGQQEGHKAIRFNGAGT